MSKIYINSTLTARHPSHRKRLTGPHQAQHTPPPPSFPLRKKDAHIQPRPAHCAQGHPQLTKSTPPAAALVTKPRSHGRRDFSWLNKPLSCSRIRLRSVPDEQPGSRERKKKKCQKKIGLFDTRAGNTFTETLELAWSTRQKTARPHSSPSEKQRSNLWPLPRAAIYVPTRKVTPVIRKKLHTTCKKRREKKIETNYSVCSLEDVGTTAQSRIGHVAPMSSHPPS